MTRILLIDDNETDLFVGKKLFLHYDDQLVIDTCLNGQAALDLLIQNRTNGRPHPDIIICDINMPVMDGYTFVNSYSELFDEERSNCCLLIYSSTLDRSEMEGFRNHPVVFDFLSKPVQPEHILNIYKEQKY